jgi:hypothetical protein
MNSRPFKTKQIRAKQTLFCLFSEKRKKKKKEKKNLELEISLRPTRLCARQANDTAPQYLRFIFANH